MVFLTILVFDTVFLVLYYIGTLYPRVWYDLYILNMEKEKKTPRQDAARRLKIAEGHLRKVIEMIEEGVYCIDVLQQTAAVKSAIKKAEEVLLVNHMNHCLVNAIKAGGKDKAVEELAQVFRKVA